MQDIRLFTVSLRGGSGIAQRTPTRAIPVPLRNQQGTHRAGLMCVFAFFSTATLYSGSLDDDLRIEILVPDIYDVSEVLIIRRRRDNRTTRFLKFMIKNVITKEWRLCLIKNYGPMLILFIADRATPLDLVGSRVDRNGIDLVDVQLRAWNDDNLLMDRRCCAGCRWCRLTQPR
jgi:hypothetical protein